ncbi:MAG: hypothetical protein ACM3VZ_10335 [Acidobacteriota bacterium]
MKAPNHCKGCPALQKTGPKNPTLARASTHIVCNAIGRPAWDALGLCEQLDVRDGVMAAQKHMEITQ